MSDLTIGRPVGDTKFWALLRYAFRSCAGVTQLVECNLAKVDVASSNLVSRSIPPNSSSNPNLLKTAVALF